MPDPYENLAQAIIVNAAKDYRSACRKLKHHPKNKSAAKLKADCESFFKSDWFTELSGLDGNMILKKLEEECR